jgi:uncharacterized protein YkwD
MAVPGDTGEVGRKLAPLALITSLALLGACGAASAAAASLVAPASVCPQSSLDAPAAAQEQTMLCLTNFARAQAGATQLEETPELEQSAEDKAGDILRCDSFSHYACGREFTYWMKATGYLSAECWRAGENLAWGAGEYGTVASIFRAWLRSPAHRANLLGEYTQIGINLSVGRLEGTRGVHIWTQHFGLHC